MKKIISLFQRNYDTDRLVRDEIVSGAEWVVEGEGVATVKWDGTAALIRDGLLYKRYDAKRGKAPPEGFIPAQDPDPKTGHWPGWIRVSDSPEDKWFREADTHKLADGTYELLGPKVQGNPYGLKEHVLVPHGEHEIDAPREFAALRDYFENHPELEGVVWHHPDGYMAKIKRRDFGLKWPTPEAQST